MNKYIWMICLGLFALFYITTPAIAGELAPGYTNTLDVSDNPCGVINTNGCNQSPGLAISLACNQKPLQSDDKTHIFKPISRTYVAVFRPDKLFVNLRIFDLSTDNPSNHTMFASLRQPDTW